MAKERRDELAADADKVVSFCISMVGIGTINGLGIFNVVGLKDIADLFEMVCSVTCGKGTDGREIGKALELEAMKEAFSAKDISCLTSCCDEGNGDDDDDGRLTVIVGKAGGTRSTGS